MSDRAVLAAAASCLVRLAVSGANLPYLRDNVTERSGRDTRAKGVIATLWRNNTLVEAKTAPAVSVGHGKREVADRSKNGSAGVSAAGGDRSLSAVSATPCFQGQLATPSMHRGPGKLFISTVTLSL